MLTNSPFFPFPDALLGCISVPSSAECARHTPLSEVDLFSKIRRKVVTRRLGVYPFPHQPSAPCTLLRRKLICSRKFIVKLCVLFLSGIYPCAAWVVSAPVHDTGLLLRHAASPASAGLGCSFSDECDTSPTETLRNLHLTGSRYLLQLADGGLLPTYNSRTAVSMYEERAARRSSSATLARTGAMNEIICSTLASSSGIPRERI